MWYNLLTQSQKNIDDLVHYWRQFCLNWHIVTEDLQRLSNQSQDPNAALNEGVSPLSQFAGEYPMLFECLYAVFGPMMSNSRLCEQIHGMMRHGLNPSIGMAQADHHRQYTAGIDYRMREERRLMGDGSGGDRENRKKALRHDKSKTQQEMLCAQLVEGSREYADEVRSELSEADITTVSEMRDKGQRHQDKENLAIQIVYEDARVSRLTRTRLTNNSVQALARITRPTNDATFTFDGILILWRLKVKEMSKITFWDNITPSPTYKQTWKLARRSLIWIDSLTCKPKTVKKNGKKISKRMPLTYKYGEGKRTSWNLDRAAWNHNPESMPWTGLSSTEDRMACFNWGPDGRSLYSAGSIYKSIKSKAGVKEFYGDYLRMATRASNLIYSFIKTKDEEGFDDKSAKKDDILFLFIRYVDGAWDDDVIEPAENALVNTCRQIDKHYTYAVTDVPVEEDDSDDDDDGTGVPEGAFIDHEA